MKRNRNDFRIMLQELKRIKKQLSEDNMYGDEMGGYPGEEEMDGYYDEEGGEDMNDVQQPRYQEQPQQPEQSDEEKVAMHAQDIIKQEPIIARIRETAIEGLKKYSEDPTSSLYEFFKKVFLESDKVLTDTGGKK